jgi:hypothetical protein
MSRGRLDVVGIRALSFAFCSIPDNSKRRDLGIWWKDLSGTGASNRKRGIEIEIESERKMKKTRRSICKAYERVMLYLLETLAVNLQCWSAPAQ